VIWRRRKRPSAGIVVAFDGNVDRPWLLSEAKHGFFDPRKTADPMFDVSIGNVEEWFKLDYKDDGLAARLADAARHDTSVARRAAAVRRRMGVVHVVRRAEFVMGWCEAIFPKRVAAEEIGDALELIARWRNDPTCKHVRAKIAVKVVTTIVVLALNAVRYAVSCWRGKKAE
jgi:hypothetical protein